MFEKKKILVIVKAYPVPSAKYIESVCCAGVDLSDNSWIRLYPIPFRYLSEDQQFKKYSIIEVECIKSTKDKRHESYRIKDNSINVIETIGTEKGTWKKRKDIILEIPKMTMCEVLEKSKQKQLSLGLIKPFDIQFSSEIRYTKEEVKSKIHKQPRLFDDLLPEIENIPYHFYYTFKCNDDCDGHKLPIIDWEIGQAYRSWKRSYPNNYLQKIEQKWMQIADNSKKDVFFYVGNMQRFPEQFMILGVFYPPLS